MLADVLTEIDSVIISTGLHITVDETALREGSLSHASKAKFEDSFVTSISSHRPVEEFNLHEEWHNFTLDLEVGGTISRDGRKSAVASLLSKMVEVLEALVRHSNFSQIKGVQLNEDTTFSFLDGNRIVAHTSFIVYYYWRTT